MEAAAAGGREDRLRAETKHRTSLIEHLSYRVTAIATSFRVARAIYVSGVTETPDDVNVPAARFTSLPAYAPSDRVYSTYTNAIHEIAWVSFAAASVRVANGPITPTTNREHDGFDVRDVNRLNAGAASAATALRIIAVM